MQTARQIKKVAATKESTPWEGKEALMELRKLMSRRQCARLLHCRDSQVRIWIKSGELAVVDLGTPERKNLRIDPADIRLFLERRKPPVPTAVSSVRHKSKADNRKTWF